MPARPLLILILLILCVFAGGCTDAGLRRYRDEDLIARHRYALGERYVEVNGLRLCYQEFGQGENVLILPGLGTSIDFWQHNIPALARDFHVVAVDPPGFGKSDKPDAAYKLGWICRQIVAFLDARGIDRTHVIGGSMGGHLALILALEYPERIDKLVLMGSVGNWSRVGPLAEIALATLWNDAVVAEFIRTQWPTIYGKMFARQTPYTRSLFYYQMAVRANGGKYTAEGLASARTLLSIIRTSCRDRLGELDRPVLVIWGQADTIHAARNGHDFRRLLPRSRLVIVPDAAHEVMVDQPATFNHLARAFLRDGLDAVNDFVPDP